MKYATAAVVLAVGASASYPAGNVTWTTEVVTSYETYCPGPTTITYGTNTYTATEATTLTITDCPCTVSAPVYTTSTAPVYPTSDVVTYPVVTPTTYPVVHPTTYPNVTAPVSSLTTAVYPTGTLPVTTPTGSIPTAAAGKVVAGLAGVLAAVAAAL